MADKQYNALIIDDHPLISEAYKSAFHKITKETPSISFKIDVAHDCDTAMDFIKQYANNAESIDVVF